jgi:mono/diheme cytochrome c family protein
VAAALLPPAIIARARATRSESPRINLIPDMDYQPKFLPQTENALFADGRAMRPEIEGTIARGELREDDHFYRGRVAEEWASGFPVPVTRELMERGQERFEIFCAPCHGLSGRGDGLVARRADELALSGNAVWTPPTSIHDETVRGRPAGHLFNTITFGIRTMPAYGSQIDVGDRWAIVAYLRALQRSSAATIEDVPESVRPTLR